MKKLSVSLVILVLVASCVPQKKYDELESKYYKVLQDKLGLEERNADLAQTKNALEDEITNLNAQIRDKQQEIDKLQSEYDALAQKSSKELQDNAAKNQELLAQLKKAREELTAKEVQLKDKIARVEELENLLLQQRERLANLKNSLKNALVNFEGKGITVEERNGKIYISMDNKLLFASGKWQVQQGGVSALSNLAPVLAEQNDLEVLIEGHTDNVPYSSGTQVQDNWDLSVMRATAITKILQNKGVSATQMTAGGRGEFFPVADNTTTEGKAKNRRVEIIITPNLDKINAVLEGI